MLNFSSQWTPSHLKESESAVSITRMQSWGCDIMIYGGDIGD